MNLPLVDMADDEEFAEFLKNPEILALVDNTKHSLPNGGSAPVLNINYKCHINMSFNKN